MIPQQKNKCKRFSAITENRLNIFAERKTFTLALYLEHIRDSLFKRRIGKLPSQYYFHRSNIYKRGKKFFCVAGNYALSAARFDFVKPVVFAQRNGIETRRDGAEKKSN